MAVTPVSVSVPEPHAGSHRARDWSAALLSGLLAIGFAAVLVSPLWVTSTSSESGEVLGDSQSQPLQVTLTIQKPSDTLVLQVQPASGWLVDVFAQAAATRRTNFSYASRGQSVYLTSFSGLTNGQGGAWQIRHNDQPAQDLYSVEVSQGDRVEAIWIPI